MKKGFGKKLLGGVLSFSSGLIGLKNPAVGLAIGVVKGIVKQPMEHIDKNINSEVGGVGKYDYAGIVGSIAGLAGVVFMAYQVYIGAITVDDFVDFFMKYLKKLG